MDDLLVEMMDKNWDKPKVDLLVETMDVTLVVNLDSMLAEKLAVKMVC
jgi:hypothetical protein